MSRMIDADALEREIKRALDIPAYGDYYAGYDAALNAILDFIADAPTIPPPPDRSHHDGLRASLMELLTSREFWVYVFMVLLVIACICDALRDLLSL